MLILRPAVFALALCLALFVDSAQSQRQPTRGGQDQTQNQQQNAATNQRGTEQFPVVVQPLSTKKSAEEAAHDAREADEKAKSDYWTWLLSILTLAVLFGQLAVFVAQAYYLYGTLKATADAANAARISAETSRDEFAATHRPKIRFKHLWFLSNVWQGEQIIVELIYVNNGPTTAVVPWFNYRTLIIPTENRLPQRPPFNTATNIPIPLPQPQVLLSGQTGTIPGITDGRTLTSEEIGSIREGRSRLYFIGTVAYHSASGQHLRQTAFARYIKFSHLPAHADDAGRFEKECDPDYEYED